MCDCHGEEMYRNRTVWRCAVEHREKARARYARQMETEEGKSSHRARWMRNYENRRDDPAYVLDRQLRDMTRII